MQAFIQIATLWQRVKHTGLVLIFVGVLTLFLLLTFVGAVISHAPQGAVSPAILHGGLIAPIGDTNEPPPQ